VRSTLTRAAILLASTLTAAGCGHDGTTSPPSPYPSVSGFYYLVLTYRGPDAAGFGGSAVLAQDAADSSIVSLQGLTLQGTGTLQGVDLAPTAASARISRAGEFTLTVGQSGADGYRTFTGQVQLTSITGQQTFRWHDSTYAGDWSATRR
jgi:hypothetical protein